MPGAFQQAFHVMRSGRPGPVLIDLPIDVQVAMIEFDPDTYAPLPVYKPRATRAQVEKALSHAAGGAASADRGGRRRDQRRRVRAARGIRGARRRAGGAHAHGLGRDPRRPSADGGDVRIADRASLRQCHDARLRFRAGHRQSLGQPAHGIGGRVHEGPHLRARGHRAHADRPRIRARLRHRLGCARGARALRGGGTGMARAGAAARPRRLGRPSARGASGPSCARRPSTTCR